MGYKLLRIFTDKQYAKHREQTTFFKKNSRYQSQGKNQRTWQ
jgi:hypothetical protein